MAVCTRELQRVCSSTLTVHGLVVITECVRRWYGTLAVAVAVGVGHGRESAPALAAAGVLCRLIRPRRTLYRQFGVGFTRAGRDSHAPRADRARDSRAPAPNIYGRILTFLTWNVYTVAPPTPAKSKRNYTAPNGAR